MSVRTIKTLTSSLAIATLLTSMGCDESVSNEAALELENESNNDASYDITNEEDNNSEPGDEELKIEHTVDPGAGAIASIDLPGDHTIWFFADESGASMTEISSNGMNYMSRDEFWGATPAQMFWALSDLGTDVPEALLENHGMAAARGEVLSWSEITDAQPQGWGIQEIAPYTAAHVACDSFASNHCPYSTGPCVVDSGFANQSNSNDEVYYYYAAVCVDSGSPYDTLRYKKQLPATCGLEANFTTVWGQTFTVGGIATHSYTASDPSPWGLRYYEHDLTGGFLSQYNWSSRYILSNCIE